MTELDDSIKEGCRACLMVRDGIECVRPLEYSQTSTPDITNIELDTRQQDGALVSNFLIRPMPTDLNSEMLGA